jgi:hypothetical protein
MSDDEAPPEIADAEEAEVAEVAKGGEAVTDLSNR